MINMDAPRHTRLRRIVSGSFTPRMVARIDEDVHVKARGVLADIAEKGECDFVNDIAAPLPMILIGDMLGVAPEDRADLLRWSDDMVSAQSGGATEAQYMKAMEAMAGYTEFCTHAVAQRQNNPTDDLMSVLVHAEVDGDRLTPDEPTSVAVLAYRDGLPVGMGAGFGDLPGFVHVVAMWTVP